MAGLASLREEWLLSLRTARKSPRTIQAYRQDIIQLTTHLAGARPSEFTRDPGSSDPIQRLAPLEQMAEIDLPLERLERRAFSVAWNDWSRGRAAQSAQRAHSAWRQFMAWVISEGLWDAANPFDQIPRPAAAVTDEEGREKRSPREKALKHDNLYGRLLDAAMRPQHEYGSWPLRDTALMSFIASTGARVSEVLGSRDWYEDAGVGGPREQALREERFAPMTLRRVRAAYETRDVDGLMVYVARGKGDKRRELFVSERTVQRIETYVQERDARIGEAICALWHEQVGRGSAEEALLDAPLWWYRPPAEGQPRPLVAQNLDTVIRRIYREAGIVKPDGASVHALRHTFLTRKADAGVPLHLVQQLAGHSSLATTQRYLHPDQQRLRDAVKVDQPDL